MPQICTNAGLGPTKSGWGCVLYRYCKTVQVFFELDELPEEIKIEREKITPPENQAETDSAKSLCKTKSKTIPDSVVGAWPCALLQRAVVYVKSGAIYQHETSLRVQCY